MRLRVPVRLLAATPSRKSLVEQRLQLGAVTLIRVIGDPGLDRPPQLNLTHHELHSSHTCVLER
jgi:hypothetical protein